MSTPTAADLRAVALERLLRRAFEDGAKWVAQVDDPARSPYSMDRGFAEFRESHHDAIVAIHQCRKELWRRVVRDALLQQIRDLKEKK